jgi:hypothetical protein
MGNYRGMTQGPEGSGDQNASRVHVSGSSGVQVGSGNVQYNFFGDSPAAGRSGSAPATRPSETADPDGQGHAFISYVHEDAAEVDWLQQALESAGVPVWRDTVNLWPGESWRDKIREAIDRDALVFIACFSRRGVARRKSYQYEELRLAIDQFRSRRPDVTWLIPARFDECDIPDFDLGGGRTIGSIQHVDLFGANRDLAASRLVATVQRLLH